MSLFLINIGMVLSLFCFYIGYYYRFRNNFFHKKINLLGMIFNLFTSSYLLVNKYFLWGIEALGITAIVPRWVVDTHRFFAAVSLVLMLLMAYSGIKKKKELHKKLHYVFLPLYSIIVISGLSIFRTQ